MAIQDIFQAVMTFDEGSVKKLVQAEVDAGTLELARRLIAA